MNNDTYLEVQEKLKLYKLLLNKKFPNETLQIIEQISYLKYNSIIVYPEAGTEKTLIKRYKNIASRLSKNGHLAILCNRKDKFSIRSLSKNLFQLSHDEYLLPLLRSKSIMVLCSHPSQLVWAECIPNKILWVDIRSKDEWETPNGTANTLLNKADIVTVASEQLKDEFHLFDPVVLPDQADFTYLKSCVKEFKGRIIANPLAWKVFSNLHHEGKLHVMTKTFLDFDGKHFYNGGAERYLLDLADIIQQKGHELVIYQYGNHAWVRRFNQTDIISLNTMDIPPLEHSIHATKEFHQRFYEQVEDRSCLTIYSPFYEAWPFGTTNNIGISHGIDWDNPYACYDNAMHFWVMNQQYIEGAGNCEELVSVDTNTANWFQTVNFEQGRKIRVIPNYVDLEKFYVKEKDTMSSRVVILYPRQLYSARGLYLVLEVIDEILQHFPEVDFHFVGRGGDEDIKHLHEKMMKWKDRIKWTSLPLEEMPKAYQHADISLIPTIHSEGTSLSCLEAMASGNAVIATRIGGLTDLIINNFNGYLIEPHASSLHTAISALLMDRDQLQLFKLRGVEVAQAFSKEHWIKKWATILDKKINKQNARPASSGRLIEIQLEKLPKDKRSLGKTILSYLKQGDLVYVRVKNEPAHPFFSFGRIQWLGWDEPTFSVPDEIIEFTYEGEPADDQSQ